MIKYMDDEFKFQYENNTYWINYSGSWTADYGRWIENFCNYNVYDDEGAEVDDNKVLLVSEKALQLELWSVL